VSHPIPGSGFASSGAYAGAPGSAGEPGAPGELGDPGGTGAAGERKGGGSRGAGRRASTRRGLLRGAGWGAGAGLLGAAGAACGGAPAPSGGGAATRAPATLSLLLSLNETLWPQFQSQLIDPYKAEHPNVTVELIPYGGGTTAVAVEKLFSLATAGSPPNAWDGPRGADWMVG
jgi:hypothetical protein